MAFNPLYQWYALFSFLFYPFIFDSLPLYSSFCFLTLWFPPTWILDLRAVTLSPPHTNSPPNRSGTTGPEWVFPSPSGDGCGRSLSFNTIQWSDYFTQVYSRVTEYRMYFVCYSVRCFCIMLLLLLLLLAALLCLQLPCSVHAGL